MNSSEIIIRKIEPCDSVRELTQLLNLAYAPMARLGLKYLASHQDDSITLKRIDSGECYIAIKENRILGTICYYPPGKASGCPLYETEGTSSFGQFAVHPDLQGSGLGSRLLELIENQAKADKSKIIALDTSIMAIHLIRYYEKRGYKYAGKVDWDETNYESVLMSKKLF